MKIMNLRIGVISLFASLLIIQSVNAQEVLNLETCRKLAIERNKDLKSADYSKQEAMENQKAARTAYLPGLSLTSSIMYRPNMDAISMPGDFLPTASSAELAQKGEFTATSDVWMPGMNLDLGNLSLIMTDITVQQPIYAGGKIKYLNKQADAGVEIFKHAYQLKYDEVIEQTDQAYWNLISVSANVELAEKYIEMLTELEDLMTEMHKLGLCMLSEKLKVSVQKNQAELNLVKIKNGLRIAKMYLNHVTGQELQKNYTILNSFDETSDKFKDLSVGLDQALTNRNELKILNEQLNISKYDQKIALSDYLPEIGVSAGYSSIYIDDISENLSFDPSFAAQVSIPIFQWGQGRYKQNAAKLKVKKAEIELENTSLLISLEIQKVKSQLEEAFETVLISDENLKVAKTSLEETQSSFEVGLNTVTDVLNAQANWKNAKVQRIGSLAQYESLQTTWLKVTGQIKHQ